MEKNLIVNSVICLIMAAHEGQITNEEAERKIQKFRQDGRLSGEEYVTASLAADLIKLGIEPASAESIHLAGGYQ